MRALSIRQPFAELILRGIKTIEYRSIATKIIGERFWIYASRKPATTGIWSRDLSSITEASMPSWMIEVAEHFKIIPAGTELPMGVIVGSAVVERVRECGTTNGESGMYAWELRDVERAETLIKPTRHPQPVWFQPF